MNAENFPKTQLEAFRFFENEENCHEVMKQIRWTNGEPVCPQCKSKEIGRLIVTTREIKGRTLKDGTVIEPYMHTRRLWQCRVCRKQFTVKVGSIFEDSPLALDKWLCGLWLIVNAKNGISSCEIARTLGITQKSAWFLAHRLRAAIQGGSFEKMGGIVEADESFIGAKARTMNAKSKAKRRALFGKGTGGVAMTPVQGLLERGTREKASRIRLAVIKSTKKADVQAGVRGYVLKGSQVMTDELGGYRGLDDEYTHNVINHAECYVKGNVHTNGLENFWSLLKRTIKGTYVNVEPFHLFRYLDEQAYRFNERKDEDGDKGRFLKAIAGIFGKRLTWDKLTGKNEALPDCLPIC